MSELSSGMAPAFAMHIWLSRLSAASAASVTAALSRAAKLPERSKCTIAPITVAPDTALRRLR